MFIPMRIKPVIKSEISIMLEVDIKVVPILPIFSSTNF